MTSENTGINRHGIADARAVLERLSGSKMSQGPLFCSIAFLLLCIINCPGRGEDELSRVAIGAEVKKSPRFGDVVTILVTLTNTGDDPLTIPAGKLYLRSGNWGGAGTGGTRGGDQFRLASEDDPEAMLLIPSKGHITLSAKDRGITVLVLGLIRADYSMRADDVRISRLLPKEAKISVAFDVAPSELMGAFWNAGAERGKLRADLRTLLELRARARDWGDRHYVENTLKYVAGLALPILEALAHDSDPIMRSQAIEAYRHSSWAVANMNAMLTDFGRAKSFPGWARGLVASDAKAANQSLVRLATESLQDADARVRLSAVEVLGGPYPLRELGREAAKAAVEAVTRLSSDPDPKVRSAVQAFLSHFAQATDVADTVVASLSDTDPKVREQALAALEKAPSAPPLTSLKQAFQTARGKEALRLIALLFEQEDSALPGTVVPRFQQGSQPERLAMLSVIAGHHDTATLDLVKLGLSDSDIDVQRAALLRLLAFSKELAAPLVEDYIQRAPAALRDVAKAVRSEIEQRRILPFMSDTPESYATAPESVFPSQNGTVPMVSPDGQWLAYVETGWGRPGGTGGFGGSNMISLVHAVRSDGTDDRIISDMFLARWLEDSRRIASVDAGHATICDLDGEPIAEFGENRNTGRQEQLERFDWRKGELRQQFGVHMPHRKSLWAFASERMDDDRDSNHSGLFATFSPDGKLFGPLRDRDKIAFFGPDSDRIDVKLQAGFRIGGRQATWSPTGRHVVLMPGRWTEGTLIIDMETKDSRLIADVETPVTYGSWEYRRCRWNPWSRDGAYFAFVRRAQVWISRPDGSEARQLTFDSLAKVFPTFSRDGTRIAYVTWQPDNRKHYTRPGPTDLWIVDLSTTLAARATAPANSRIHCLDWLDNDTLIFDRLEPTQHVGYQSTLRRISLHGSRRPKSHE